MNQATYTAAQGRRFALTLATAFAVIAAFVWWRDPSAPAAVMAAIALMLGVAAIVIPSRLAPLERAWMRLAYLISKVTTPIFMGIVYFLVLTPTGIIRRSAGKNPLMHDPVDGSYWKSRSPVAPSASRRRMERQF